MSEVCRARHEVWTAGESEVSFCPSCCVASRFCLFRVEARARVVPIVNSLALLLLGQDEADQIKALTGVQQRLVHSQSVCTNPDTTPHASTR